MSSNGSLSCKNRILFSKLSQHAKQPTQGSKLSAGFDLYSAEKCIVKAKSRQLIKTDISLEIPPGHYGRVAPRSGLAVRNFIDVGAGVVDSDYRGNLSILLFNFSETDFEVKIGDRIAQLIIEKILICEMVEVELQLCFNFFKMNDTTLNYRESTTCSFCQLCGTFQHIVVDQMDLTPFDSAIDKLGYLFISTKEKTMPLYLPKYCYGGSIGYHYNVKFFN
ncbi:hypothetical protein A3Q56_04131 [Intoshia linei]|uniref:Deoxyuridine 5'-triphosphate nucleotidohydrolase n=1 Tax=Intoshia linei TaxID=1819745 RepID=A0A177B1H5_9BILA|nr:hypothetical protein A3Q56_04131 [Intoshia linei]